LTVRRRTIWISNLETVLAAEPCADYWVTNLRIAEPAGALPDRSIAALRAFMAAPLRVLIVEDEPMISMYLEEIVEETVPAIVTIRSSVKATRRVIDEPFHLALLDVDVTDGKTYEIAKTLDDRRISFVFISGALNHHFPDELLDAPFIKKPFTEFQIKEAVLAADRRRSSSTIAARLKSKRDYPL
jgi:response regulator RpfG family c-di-GMP phosphodiesterase